MKLAFLKRMTLSYGMISHPSSEAHPNSFHALKSLLTRIGLALFLGYFFISCIAKPEQQLAQGLRGTIVPISDLTKLECLLTTGDAREEGVNWTEAQRVNLERKSSGQYEKITSGETVKYNYGSTSKGGKGATGYINYFPYISVDNIKKSPRAFHKSSSGEWNYKVVKEGEREDQVVKTKTPLICDNLLQPEEIPFLIAKPHYSYTVRFQVVGNKARALLLAPAEDLPSQSLVYSYKISDKGDQEIYAMPIGGYHVFPGYIEQQENTDWEATNVLGFKKVPIRKRGKYKTESIAGIPSSWPTYQDGDNSSRPVREVQFASEFTAFKSLAEQGGKRDVYSKAFFSGDWYHASTVISNSVVSPKAVPGLPFSFDSQSWVSNKVRLDFRDQYLVAYTLNKETESDKEPRSISAEREVFRIPISHLDYRDSSPLGDLNAGLEEVPDITKEDRKKNYFQTQFDQIELSRFGRLIGSQLSEITVSEDYFSFVLHSEANEYRMRFSFLRPVPKEDRVYSRLIFDKTFEKFPPFRKKRRVNLMEALLYSEKFQESLTVRRFDPEQPVVYRFSTLTPNNLLIRNIGREIIAVWAQIFEKAGVSCVGGPCVQLLPEAKDDAELGDIRYNILNLISPDDFLQFGFFNGLGPSISDFETGEVISVTANLYLDNMYAQLVNDIYHYIQSRSGIILPWDKRQELRQKSSPGFVLEDKLSFPMNKWNIRIPRFLLSWSSESWRYKVDSNESLMIDDQVPFSGLDWKVAEEGYRTIDFLSPEEDHSPSENEGESSPFQARQTSFPGAGNDFHCELQSGGFLPSQFRYRLIETLCGEHLTFLTEISGADIVGQSSHERRNWLWEKSKHYTEEIHQCAGQLLRIAGLGVGLHEVGHNMSMPHNFAASADKNNFLPVGSFHYSYTFENDEQKKKVFSLFPPDGATASVMDYIASGEIRMAPGKYDTDFIRFLYKKEMETENGELVTAQVNDGGELQYVNSGGEVVSQRELRQYKVCDDRSYRFSEDIYCNLWDRGTTPSEIVSYYRNYFMDNLSLYGSFISPFTHVVGKSVERFFRSTERIYHKWRVELSKELGVADPLHLKEINTEQYRERITEILCEKGALTALEETDRVGEVCGPDGVVKDEEFAELYKARTIIYRTFRDLLFSTQDHYCVLKDIYKDNLEEWVPFSEIHRHLVETSHEDLRRHYSEISSCEDVNDLIGRTGREYIGETGIPLFPGVFSVRQDRENDFYRLLRNRQVDYSGSIQGRVFAGISLFGYSRTPVLNGRRELSLINEPDIREDIFQTLTNRILKGIRVDIADEEAPVFYPAFSNEELLWNVLSLPLFSNSRHPTTSIDTIIGSTKSLAVTRFSDFVDRNLSGIKNDFVQRKRVLEYDRILRQGGYIIEESKELYPSERGAFALLNENRMETDSSYLTQLIQSLRAIDLRKSFLNFTGEIHKEDPKASFQSKKEKANSYMEDLKTAVKELYSDPSLFVNMLTFSLLYDYLEVGEPSALSSFEPNYGVITNLLVQQLQLIWALQFKMRKVLNQECTEDSGICFEFHSIPESDQEREEFFEQVEKEKNFDGYGFNDMLDSALFKEKQVGVVDIAKPYIIESVRNLIDIERLNDTEDLIYNCNRKATCNEVFDLLQELYLMELFRSDHYAGSFVRTFLEKSLRALENEAILGSKSGPASKRRAKVHNHIALLRTLKDHVNSKLFQEIFIRGMLFYFWRPYRSKYVSAIHVITAVLDQISPLYVTEFFDVRSVAENMSLRRDRTLDARERMLLAVKFYDSLFLGNIELLEIFQYFQRNASDDLEQSFQEVMNMIRIAPPLPNNPDNGLEHFYSAFSLDPVAPLYKVFNGRIFRELEAQKNIIIGAIAPRLVLRDEGSGVGETQQ